MRLFNQSKNELRWTLGGSAFEAEPWGPVDVPDEFVAAVRKLGVPLAVSPVAPEARARQKVSDDATAQQDSALRGLKQRAEVAEADARAAREELERLSIELSKAREGQRTAEEAARELSEQLARAKADAKAAEGLLSEQASKAAEAEEKALRAEAMLVDRAEKPKKSKQAEG
ncbi:MAG TPA: hypothetical protein VFR23_24745 [Jiangellaceae bacterium]|nr:hypothetical protein [Jiangellaceae bacterium]